MNVVVVEKERAGIERAGISWVQNATTIIVEDSLPLDLGDTLPGLNFTS